MAAAYVDPGTNVPTVLLAEIVVAGFEVLAGIMETADQYDARVAAVEAHGL